MTIVLNTNCHIHILSKKAKHRFITDDKHFKVLENIPFPKVICIRLEEFHEIWMKMS